ncbi:MAG: winged helix-turn-helix domain-containing protein [Vicinamibacterales bacterium]
MAPGIAGYQFGPFRLDLASMQLLRLPPEGGSHGPGGGYETIPLTPKVFDTLVVLLRHRGRVVGKEELVRHVWGDTVVSEDSLSQSISILRRALGDDRHHAEYVATVARRGYRFIAPVEEIAHAEAGGPSVGVAPAPGVAAPTRGVSRHVAAVLVIAAAIAGVLAGNRLLPSPSRNQGSGPLQFTLEAPPGTTLRSGAQLSPDNQHVMFVAEDPTGTTAVWVRPITGAEPWRLPGTDDASRPFWSPDGLAVGFFAGGYLKRVGLSESAAQSLTAVGLTPGGGSWAPQGEILFAGWRSGLSAVPATGGAPRPVTTLDTGAGERAHTQPQFLPDGRHFLFHVDAVEANRSGTFVTSLDDPTQRVRILDVGGASYVAPDHLAYVRDGALLMHPFDTDARQLRGEPWVLAGNVMPPRGEGTISSSPGGLLSFGGGTPPSRLAWYSRSGQAIDAIDTPVPLRDPVFTRDGRQFLASDGQALWTVDVARSSTTRLANAGVAPYPSPDGSRIAFTSDRNGGISQIYVRSAGAASDELLLETPENKIVNDWTRDGRFLVYVTTNARTLKDIWLLPMDDADRTPRPYLVTPFNDIQAQVSPDGRWLAYASDESGRWEVYLQAFPDAGRKRVLSVGGGAAPQWRADGRELYYLSPSRRVMAVTLELAGDERIGAPVALFDAPVRGRLNSFRNHFLASADGQRFLVDAVEPGQRNPVTFLVNWR